MIMTGLQVLQIAVGCVAALTPWLVVRVALGVAARHASAVGVSLQTPPAVARLTRATALVEVFRASLAQEEQVTQQINALYDLAMQEKDFAAVVEMQWFVTEQVEEEKSARDIIAKLEMAGNDARALLEIDRELGARAGLSGGSGRGSGRPGE